MEQTGRGNLIQKHAKTKSLLAHASKRCDGQGEIVINEEMNQNHSWAFFPSLFLVLSLVGLAIVPLLVIQPNLNQIQFTGQRNLIGALFSAICVSGVVAVFYPRKCRGVFQHAPNPTAKAETFSNHLRIEGHHPNCLTFSKNRIKIGGKNFCAACSGLLVGTIVALLGAIFYFFGSFNMVPGSIWLVVMGEIGLGLGLIQIKVAGSVKAFLNAVFVVGSFATLATVDEIGKSLFLDLYILGLILYLLWFRISLSEWNNTRTCRNCQRCSQ
jgi:hypothetical protein